MVYTYNCLKELFHIYMFLIHILFASELEGIMNSRDSRLYVNFAIYSYLIFAYRQYSPCNMGHVKHVSVIINITKLLSK